MCSYKIYFRLDNGFDSHFKKKVKLILFQENNDRRAF